MNLILKKQYPIREASELELRRLYDAVDTDRSKRLSFNRDKVAQNAFNFNLNPAITPIPTAAAWIYAFGGNAANTLNATSTNSSTTLTINWPCTTALAVGQPISGLNILPNTTIATVGATTVTLSQATSSSGAATGAVTVINNYSLGSTLFGSNTFYGFPAASAVDVPGCSFFIPETQTLLISTTASVFIPAPGQGFLTIANGATTGSTIQLQTAAGTWTTFATATVSVTSGYYIGVDGGNVRINALGAASATMVFYRWRSGPQF